MAADQTAPKRRVNKPARHHREPVFHTYCSPAALPASLGIIDGKAIRKEPGGDNDPCFVLFFRAGRQARRLGGSMAARSSGERRVFIGTARRLECQPAGTGTADAPLSPAVPREWIMGGALLSHQEIPSGCRGGRAKRHDHRLHAA